MLIAGIVMLVVAIGLGIAAALVRRRSDQLRTMDKLTCTEIAQQAAAAASAIGTGHFRKEVATSGTVIPTGDLLTAPMSGTLCLWHRTVIRRRYEDRPSGSSNSTTTKTRVEHDASSQQRFAISDGTTTVQVDPQRISVQDPECTVDAYEPAGGLGGLLAGSLQIAGLQLNLGNNVGGRTLGIERVEYVLRPGVQLYAAGPVADVGGTLLMGGRDGSTLTLSPRSVEEQARSKARLAAWLAIGSAVVLAVAVALIVVSIVR